MLVRDSRTSSANGAFGVRKHLGVGRAASGCLFLGSLPALILDLAAVEAHVRNRVRSGARVNRRRGGSR
jgi:hypothetical protein